MAGLLDSYTIKGLTLKNRIMMSPMCQYVANTDGTVSDWHFVHYGARAIGGVGLIMLEASAVEARGRISMHDIGIWSDDHIAGLRRIVDFGHQYGASMGIQIAHAGVKAETDEPNVAPSALTHFPRYTVPQELSVAEIGEIVEKFKAAAVRAVQAGFDTVELHGAHGYLLNEFLSPLTNKRTDEYGGTLENRLRFPLQVISAVKSVLPVEMPLLMRVSASEYSEESYSLDEMVSMVTAFKEAGVDMVDCSSGGALPVAPPAIYPGYQVQFAEAIKRGADIPTIAVGLLDNPALAEEVVRNGRADLVAIARGLLRDPHWAKVAALALKAELELPSSYARAY
ncbi:NADPH dehydrogenase NamA [Tumebacillus permanentifrigoris]|uniref:NADPH2 dehydrogenase n=1 Tax=Tumebacillus permanentifrigoris TaxID=378543 RepID=A0A316D9L0_9BACL|nr:NADPH dehydrogenase NamA [Tumebacillus permanentifrigoris]PWK11622.1 NADPH2 dehydrogenase [Tumebacillus permanentifrigoris]